MLEVSGGTQYEGLEHIIPCQNKSRGVNVYEASEIKNVVGIPVYAVGKINDIRYAAEIVERGLVDGVAMGRPASGRSGPLQEAVKASLTRSLHAQVAAEAASAVLRQRLSAIAILTQGLAGSMNSRMCLPRSPRRYWLSAQALEE